MPRTMIAAALLLAGCAGMQDGCPTYLLDCGGVCVDVLTDGTNCGACGTRCDEGQVCASGACTLECPEGYLVCGGVCRDVTSDQYNCGACGSACLAGFLCFEGSCAPDCPDGYEECSGTCRNTTSDPSHCGACFHACAAGEVCMSGSCSFTCPSPYVDCSGSCADLDSDHANCGSCGNACGPGEICSGGTCTTSCYEGLTMCSGACVDLMRDPLNCGSCGLDCVSGEVCYDGTCTASCPGGFTDCSGSCRDLDSDRLNCGSCDNACASGEVCVSGACDVTCGTGLVECSGVCSDPTSDPDNCGSCGTACAYDEACVSGSCAGVDVVWDPSVFPVSITGPLGGWSNLDLDGGRDLIVPGQGTNNVYRVSRAGGAVTTIATAVGTTSEDLVSIAWDETRSRIYVGCYPNTIYSVDPSTGASSLLYNTAASSINCLAVAPTGWGSHGGHVITATNTGVVLAVDPGVPSMTTIASGLSSLSDCEFGADGRLYVVAYSTNSVIVVGPTGTTTTIATGFSSADGIALDTARDRMWVADSSLDQLFEVVISTGTRTLLGSYDFDSGYYPSGLVFDGVNTLIMSTGESSLTLRAISVP